jgi:hypothetical protein
MKHVSVEHAIAIIKNHGFNCEIIDNNRISFDATQHYPSEQPIFESIDIENDRVSLQEIRDALGY